MAMQGHMPADRIDFISEYCDRWCERCAFTERCSSFAVHAALAMCDGDAEAAMELAVGRPRPVTPGDDPPPGWMADLPNVVPTDAEIAAETRRQDARRNRIKSLPLSILSEGVMMLCLDWLKQQSETTAPGRSPALEEAVAIVHWDVCLIYAKIHRALSGRDDAASGEWFPDEDRVQSDWNGSARVALMCVERSSAAWGVIAAETGDLDARRLASELEALQAELDREFPDARRFRRPGFDRDGA
jgi:hypothetical protein